MSELYEAVSIEFGVSGIWRKITCFVAPDSTPSHPIGEGFGLLLGIPWLHAINAVMAIRESSILIGDPGLGETVQKISGTKMGFSDHHNLITYPRNMVQKIPGLAGSSQTKETKDIDSDTESVDSLEEESDDESESNTDFH